MKKMIPIQLQLIFSWIPCLNFLVQFMWLYNCSKMENSTKIFLRSLWPSFAIVIFFSILQAILIHSVVVSKAAEYILSCIIAYTLPLLLGLYVVRYQRRLYRK